MFGMKLIGTIIVSVFLVIGCGKLTNKGSNYSAPSAKELKLALYETRVYQVQAYRWSVLYLKEMHKSMGDSTLDFETQSLLIEQLPEPLDQLNKRYRESYGIEIHRDKWTDFDDSEHNDIHQILNYTVERH